MRAEMILKYNKVPYFLNIHRRILNEFKTKMDKLKSTNNTDQVKVCIFDGRQKHGKDSNSLIILCHSQWLNLS